MAACLCPHSEAVEGGIHTAAPGQGRESAAGHHVTAAHSSPQEVQKGGGPACCQSAKALWPEASIMSSSLPPTHTIPLSHSLSLSLFLFVPIFLSLLLSVFVLLLDICLCCSSACACACAFLVLSPFHLCFFLASGDFGGHQVVAAVVDF